MGTRRERAQRLLRWLVQQKQPVTYKDATHVIGGCPQGVAHPLGIISQGIQAIHCRDYGPLPPIQLIVVKKDTGAPGDGAAQFLDPPVSKTDYAALTNKEQQAVVKFQQDAVFRYHDWSRVLDAFDVYLYGPTTSKRKKK